MYIDKRKLITMLIGLAAAIIAAVIVLKVVPAEKVPSPDTISTSIDRHHPKTVADSTATLSEAELLIGDIEHSIHSEDGWAGKTYSMLLNIKRLDTMRDTLTPEQLELLESYKQQYPDWEEIDE